MLPPNTFLHNKRYQIIRSIGLIGIGSVYEAQDSDHDRRVALKEMLITDPAFRRTFEQSVEQLKRCSHPALCDIKGHFVDGNWQYLVMEYIEGQDLALQMSQKRRAFAVEEVLTWTDDLLDALAYLHAQEPPLIHHDINPANLKLTPDKQIVLTDFALTGHIEAQTGYSWQDYALNYAAPEQIAGQITDARSDLYSLAATLYYLLTGDIPLAAQARLKFMVDGYNDPLPPANDLNPDISPALAEWLTLCMALEPAERPACAKTMQAMLREICWNKPEVPDVSLTKDFETAAEAEMSEPEAPSSSSPEAHAAAVAEMSEPEAPSSSPQEVHATAVADIKEPETPSSSPPEAHAAAVAEMSEPEAPSSSPPEAHAAAEAEMSEPEVLSSSLKEEVQAFLADIKPEALLSSEPEVPSSSAQEAHAAAMADIKEPEVPSSSAQEAHAAAVADIKEPEAPSSSAQEAHAAAMADIKEPEVPSSTPQEAVTGSHSVKAIELIESENTFNSSTATSNTTFVTNHDSAENKAMPNDASSPQNSAHITLWPNLPKPFFSQKTKQFIFVVLLLLLMSLLNMLWISWNGPNVSGLKENDARMTILVVVIED